jgi:hypothetical protein
MTRPTAIRQDRPYLESLEPRLLLSADARPSPLESLLPHALTASIVGGTDVQAAADSVATAADKGVGAAARKPPTPPSPPPQPPSATPPAFMPGAGAYTADSGITGMPVTTASGQQILVVRGTEGADWITVSQLSGGLVVTVVPPDQLQTGSISFAGTFAGVVIYGFGGNDVVRLNNTVTVTSVVYGGAGNDQIFAAGPGVDYLFGGDGDDLLVSVGGKADVVRGEAGLDGLWVDSTDLVPDVSVAETAVASVHTITSFLQPTKKASVSLEIAGQDLVDPATSYKYYNFSSTPLWIDGPEYNDVVQGYLGDCYYLAALGSLAGTHPDLVGQMIAPMGDGTYAVRFYQNGSPVYVRVDAQLPGTGPGSLIYADRTPDGELWVALTEKAYAQFRDGRNSYQSIVGGWVDVTYTEITGLSSEWWSTTHWTSNDALGTFITDELAKGYTLGGGTKTSAGSPIIGNHAYEILDAAIVGGAWTVTVYNPWGIDGVTWDSNPDDGILVISMDTFRQNYDTVYESYA